MKPTTKQPAGPFCIFKDTRVATFLERPNRFLIRCRLGHVRFPKGFYIYVGSAMANLSHRLRRHQRIHKRVHWHIDRLRPHARFVAALPIRSSDRLECGLARSIDQVAAWSIPGFGCSDCRCKSHLFGMRHNPLDNAGFHDLLAWYRMDRLAASP